MAIISTRFLKEDLGEAGIVIKVRSKSPLNLFLFLDAVRVEKKERARLKTVKFHARTGMIESNRVSAAWVFVFVCECEKQGRVLNEI